MLLWFRQDLRTHDNPALHYFLENTSRETSCKAIFFVLEKQWQSYHWADIKIDFIKRHAQALVAELATLNIELDIVAVADFSQQLSYLKNYCQTYAINTVVANSELEYYEQQRDRDCIAQGIPLTLYEADVIVPKGKVLNKSGTMFKVFTPFKKAWLSYLQQAGFDYLGKVPAIPLADNRAKKAAKHKRQYTVKEIITNPLSNGNEAVSLSSAWPLACDYEADVLPKFLQNKLVSYASQRDIPAIKGTSGISPYLATGVISPRYVLRLLLQQFPDLLVASDSEPFAWLNELIWREFYRHLLYHQPRLNKHQCFQEKYQTVQWHNNEVYFKAWCAGKTGYPLVDAAMRQLKQTGWMHNRLRMVVASFLTKHLLIDWRLGEQYFMQHLIDGDLAANNGGWQWASSTGCDAQPYFRIFNPIRQSERFDPKGLFIRKYIPELENIPDKHIHFPQPYIEKQQLSVYVKPIVEHKEARLKALAFYK